MDFFRKLGFTFNAQFTDETAACMIISEDIFVMLLTANKFKTFTPKQICDATKSTEVLVCLSSASRDEVNEMVRKAVGARGNNLQGAGRPRLYVWSRIPGSGWTHLGVGLHGAERN
jgi:predicted lactoylglutathione lyase